MASRTEDDGLCRVLIAGPEGREEAQRLASALKGCEVWVEPSHELACEQFFHTAMDLVVLSGPEDGASLGALRFCRTTRPMVPVIVVTSRGSEEFAVNVFRSGAWDYFKKPFDPEEFNAAVRAALGMREPITVDPLTVTDRGLARAFKFVAQHYNCSFRLKEIAREAGMSVSRFARSFKETTGTTFVNYLNGVRVARAREILKEGGTSITDVAVACGFTNPFHFSRTFKRITGTSPTTFRKLANGRMKVDKCANR
jgi:AraC-like DNA-binding protein